MKLKDLLIELSHNELSNLAVSTEAGYLSIRPTDRAAVVTSINDGLIELHTDLLLRKNSTVVITEEDTNEYSLIYGKGYLPETFEGNVLQILSIHSTTDGEESINYLKDGYGIDLLTPLTFKIYKDKASAYLVRYKELHERVEDDCDEIDVPAYIIPILKNYVAYKIHSRMNTQEAMVAGGRYYAAYREAVTQLIYSNTHNESRVGEDSDLFRERGWV